MKRIVLVLSIIIISIMLNACTKATEPTTIEFDSYDFTDLENCISALVDQDEGTDCSIEDSRAYSEDYANYLLPYFLDDTEAAEIDAHVFYFEVLMVTFRFNELPSSLQNDVLIMNQIIDKINTDIQNITDNLEYDMTDYPQIYFRGESLTDELVDASFAYSATMNNDDYFTNYRMITLDSVEDNLDVGLNRLENVLDYTETSVSAITVEHIDGARINIIMYNNDNTYHANSTNSMDEDTLRTEVESRFPNYSFTN